MAHERTIHPNAVDYSIVNLGAQSRLTDPEGTGRTL